MMRKIISLALVILMIFSCCMVGYAETQEESETKSVDFEPAITNVVKNQAKEWFASEDMRAMVTILLALDLSVTLDADSDIYPDLSRSSFVGKEGLDLAVYLHGQAKDVIIVYRPISGEAYYMETDESSDAIVGLVMDAVCTEGYYENDVESMYSVTQEIQAIFES